MQYQIVSGRYLGIMLEAGGFGEVFADTPVGVSLRAMLIDICRDRTLENHKVGKKREVFLLF